MIHALKSDNTKLDKVIFCGHFCVIILLVLLTLFSTIVPLSDSSLVQGFVTVGSNRKTIAHLDGGKVDKIYAQIGDIVRKDQPLVKINDHPLRTELNILEHQLYARYAKIDRLQSERQKHEKPSIRQSLIEAAKNEPIVREILESEQRNFEARRNVFKAQAALLDSEIERSSKKDRNLRQQWASVNRQIEIASQQVRNAEDLVSRGFGTKTKLIELRREKENLLTEGLSIENLIDDNTAFLGEYKVKKKSQNDELAGEIETRTIEVKEEIKEAEERRSLIQDKIRETMIVANSDGVIVDIFVRSEDDVVLPASPIMEIVPQNSDLLVEAGIPPHDIDGVNEGAEVEVRFPAFANGDVPSVRGTVSLVSADVIADDRQPYYRVHVTVEDWSDLGSGFDVIPGMPSEIIIRKKDRTLANYILGPIADHIAKAFL